MTFLFKVYRFQFLDRALCRVSYFDFVFFLGSPHVECVICVSNLECILESDDEHSVIIVHCI